MAVDADRSGKVNLGLSVKFEGKSQKVIDYSRKTDRYWEFSQETVALVKEYKVTGLCLECLSLITSLCRKTFLRS